MTIGEIVRSNVLLARRSSFTRGLGILMAALALFGMAAGDQLSLAFFVLGVSFVTGWFIAPFAWYQARKRPDLVGAEWRLTADERGLHVASPMLNGLSLWSTFKVVRETGEFFFLDTGSGMNVIIPKRVFDPADLATFYRLLDRNALLKGGA